MRRLAFPQLAILALVQFILCITPSKPSLAQEWAIRAKPRGTLRVVNLFEVNGSVMFNYAEGLITTDKDNNWVPGLAADWRWLDDYTIEFKLREGVRFHNGEKFNAEAVRINWEEYRKMESPRLFYFTNLPDEMIFETVDEYTVRFTFPEPDGLAFVKFFLFCQFAPAFFKEHKFPEKSWAYLPQAGPWGTGPFKFVEGRNTYASPSDQEVLEAFEDYWDRRYPHVHRVIFENTLLADRERAMRLCRESEGSVDVVTHIRPLDTLKVAESPFAKVVKSKDVTSLTGTLNQRKKDSKWRDIRVRKAINYAINREELWKYGAKGNAYNLGGHIPPDATGHNPNMTLYTYDTDKARSLLADAGYPDGFEVNIIAFEAWKLEAQIISKMLERVGLKVKLNVMSGPEIMKKYYIPILDKPPEDQDWDVFVHHLPDPYGHPASVLLSFGLTEASEMRWIEYDQVYEEMWRDMAREVNPKVQGEKIRQLEQYIYDGAYLAFIYSPLTLYAVNKEVNFVPEKSGYLRLKETSVTDSHWSLKGEDQ